jgi:hypothetical protein
MIELDLGDFRRRDGVLRAQGDVAHGAFLLKAAA